MINILLAANLGVCDIIVIVCCAVFVIGVIAAAIIRKAKGKGGCSGDCGYCSGCSHCKPAENADKVERKINN